MLDRIQKKVYETYKPTDVKWFFLSLYDEKGWFIGSQWSIQPEKDLDTLIPLLYNVLSPDHTIGSAIVDVVDTFDEILDKNAVVDVDMKTHGICVLSTGVSGVLLPWTEWISSSKDALAAIKKKYSLTGKIRVFVFTTHRIVVE